MITFIRGKIVQCQPTFLIVEAGGIGYFIHISLSSYSKLLNIQETKILTHQIIKEDGHFLYGFVEEEERTLFVQLISVNGVGPNTARVILSYLEIGDIKSAIVTGDDVVFRKVKGVGPKTAQRIIIDLKDKIVKESSNEDFTIKSKVPNIKNEALSAMLALGFVRTQVEQVLRMITENDLNSYTLEDLIKLCLKKLS